MPVLEACGDWTATVLEAAVKAHAETSGMKLGKLAQPLRAALTGTSTSPGIFDVLEVLGPGRSHGADQVISVELTFLLRCNKLL